MADAVTPAEPPDLDAAARGHRFAKGLLLGGLAATAFFAIGTERTLDAIARLERDEVQVIALWGPLTLLYRVGGRWAAAAPGILATLLSMAAAWLGGLALWNSDKRSRVTW